MLESIFLSVSHFIPMVHPFVSLMVEMETPAEVFGYTLIYRVSIFQQDGLWMYSHSDSFWLRARSIPQVSLALSINLSLVELALKLQW